MGAGHSKPDVILRREREVRIQKPAEGENRDAGKVFIVMEVDAVQAEEWGLRALMALGTGGIQIPPELLSLGILAIPLVGYQVFMGAKEEAVLPLWREMLPACVKIKHSDSNFEKFNPANANHVEEVSTLLELRKTVLELHTGFTLAELTSRFASMGSAFMKQSFSTTQDGQSQAG